MSEEQIYKKNLLDAFKEAEARDDEAYLRLSQSYIDLSHPGERYRDWEFLGEGAFKEVYKVYDQTMKRYVALALLKESRGARFFDTFIHEAWLTSSLQHPNIIKAYDIGLHEGTRPYFTMDLKQSMSFRSLVLERVGETYDKERVREVLLALVKVCDAVSFAHSQGVVHLDLKPDNIQCGDHGDVLLCDWGLGKSTADQPAMDCELNAELSAVAPHTLYGEIKGTVGYMAREQVVEGGEKGPWTDVYGLGCVLHFILVGAPPFSGEAAEYIHAVQHEEVCSLRARYPDRQIPKSLDAITRKALARLPEERYASVAALQADLQCYLASMPTSAEAPGMWRRATLYTRRHKRSMVVLWGALCWLLGVSLWFLAQQREKSRVVAAALAEQREVEALAEYESKVTEAFLDNSNETLFADFLEQDPRVSFENQEAILKLTRSLAQRNQKTYKLNAFQDLVCLNLARALSYSGDEGLEKFIYHQNIAQVAPHYNFTADRRPSIAELRDFLARINRMREHGGKFAGNYFHPFLMASIIHYDWHSRPVKDGYTPVLIEFLQYANQHIPSFQQTWSEEQDHLTLSSHSHISTPVVLQDKTVLTYLKLKTLSLALPVANVCILHGATIEVLDLSAAQSIVKVPHATEPIKVQGLQQIIIDPSLHRAEEVRVLFGSGDQVEIVLRRTEGQ